MFCRSNLLCSIPTSAKRLSIISGFGFNSKGFVQQGMESDGTARYYHYTTRFKRDFLCLYAGIGVRMISFKRISISFKELMNPELCNWGNFFIDGSFFKRCALSCRSQLTFGRRLKGTAELQLSPYFQLALTDYGNILKSSNYMSTSYRPYGFGINLGLAF